MEDTPRLAVKMNSVAVNDPCELCGKRTDPDLGPELFLDGTWALVCYECGDKYAPELTRMLLDYRRGLNLEAFVESEQLEREISGNLDPIDEEMIDLREERLRRKAFEDANREREDEDARG
jgi:hypothetical protein